MAINSILYQLLQIHECVIIPNFGGFIVRESPCTLNAAKDRIKPFSKTIFFNQHLKENDGLLANELSKTNDIPYLEALLEIEKWVNNINLTIVAENKANIEDLGIFYKGNEDNKWFSPQLNLNLALKSYGLQPVDIKAIVKEIEETKPLEKTYEPVLTIADRAPIEKIQLPKKNWKAWAAAASIALVAHIGYLTVEHYAVNTQQASIISLPKSEVKNEILKPIEVEKVETPSEIVEMPVVEIEESTTTKVETPTENETKITQEIPFESTTSIINEIPTIKLDLIHSIGKYRLEQNAINHQLDLQKKGIKAIIQNENGLFNVMIENK